MQHKYVLPVMNCRLVQVVPALTKCQLGLAPAPRYPAKDMQIMNE